MAPFACLASKAISRGFDIPQPLGVVQLEIEASENSRRREVKFGLCETVYVSMLWSEYTKEARGSVLHAEAHPAPFAVADKVLILGRIGAKI